MIVGAASAAAAARSVSTPAAIIGINADGGRLAYVDAESKGDCGGVRVWTLSTRATQRLNGKAGARPEARAGHRARRPGPRRLPRAVGLLRGRQHPRLDALDVRAGSLVAEADPHDLARRRPARAVRDRARRPGRVPYGQDAQVIALHANGSWRFAWNAPGRVIAVAAGSGRVAVLLASGSVAVLSNTGKIVEQHAYPAGVVKAVRTSGSDLVVRTNVGLDRWSGGPNAQLLVLPPAATLQDVAGGIAVYTLRAAVRGLRLADGKDVLLHSAGVAVAGAQLEVDSGLFVATGKTVVYPLTWSQVQARFAG